MIKPKDNSVIDFHLSQDNNLFAILYKDKHVVLYDLKKEAVLTTFMIIQKLFKIKIIGDNQYLAGEMQMGQVLAFNFDGEVISYIGKKSNFLKGFVPTIDNNFMCLVYRDSMVKLWDVRKGEETQIYEGINKPINDCVLSNDGNLLYLLGNRGEIIYLNL